MADSLVYSLLHEAAPGLLARSGASRELIVRRSTLRVQEEALSGSRLFVLSFQKGRAIFSLSAQIESAFAIEEGPFTNEVLLQFSPDRTFQTTVYERADQWVIDAPTVEFGVLAKCPLDLEQRLESRLRFGWATRTGTPQQSSRRRSISGPLTNGSIKLLLSELFRDGPLDSLVRYSQHKGLSPIGSELLRRLVITDQSQIGELLTLLAVHDPLGDQRTMSPVSVAARTVDTALFPLNPDEVFARRFCAGERDMDLAAQLNKIERGELIHQRAVRRLARGLSSAGLVPLASTSFDLALSLVDGVVLFEVKSVHSNNVVSQLLSAIGQLLFYEVEFSEAERSLSVVGHIILASEFPVQIPEACYRLARRAGVGLEHVIVGVSDESPLFELAERLQRRGFSTK
jgi:hypothetical protein